MCIQNAEDKPAEEFDPKIIFQGKLCSINSIPRSVLEEWANETAADQAMAEFVRFMRG